MFFSFSSLVSLKIDKFSLNTATISAVKELIVSMKIARASEREK